MNWLAWLLVSVNAAPITPAGGDAALTAMLNDMRTAHRVPALAAAVARSDGLQWSGAVGTTLVDGDTPVTVADAFHVGSCTKAMTATLIARLVDQGQLTWDTPLAELAPVLTEHALPVHQRATLRQLLTHRAGIEALTGLDQRVMYLVEGLTGDAMTQRRGFSQRMLVLPPVVDPNSKTEYSNAGYGVAATVAEVVTGEPYETLLRRLVFEPLHLTAAGFGWPATPEQPNAVRGHYPEGDGLRVQPLDDPYRLPPFLAPAGDVHMPVAELAAFAGDHLRGLRGLPALLPPALYQQLHEPAQPVEADGMLRGYASGWGRVELPGEVVASWHNGSAGTFFAWMTVVPSADLVVTVVTNAGDAEGVCAETTARLMRAYGVQPLPVWLPTPNSANGPEPDDG